jgi:hypothetical protein
MTYAYLASPYTHTDAAVQHSRYEAVLKATAYLLSHHDWVYSPIVHCHELARVHNMPTDALFWRMYNEAMLAPADTLYLFNVNGLHESKGVRHELAYARTLKKPVHLVTPHADEYILSLYHDKPTLVVE